MRSCSVDGIPADNCTLPRVTTQCLQFTRSLIHVPGNYLAEKDSGSLSEHADLKSMDRRFIVMYPERQNYQDKVLPKATLGLWPLLNSLWGTIEFQFWSPQSTSCNLHPLVDENSQNDRIIKLRECRDQAEVRPCIMG